MHATCNEDSNQKQRINAVLGAQFGHIRMCFLCLHPPCAKPPSKQFLNISIKCVLNYYVAAH